MLKKPITFPDGREDGYEFEYCDRCGCEVGNTFQHGEDTLCTDCHQEAEREREEEYCRTYDLLEAETDPEKIAELTNLLNKLK